MVAQSSRFKVRLTILLVLLAALVLGLVFGKHEEPAFSNASKTIPLGPPPIYRRSSADVCFSPDPFCWIDDRYVIVRRDAPRQHHHSIFETSHLFYVLDADAPNPEASKRLLSNLPDGVEGGFNVSPDHDRLLTISLDPNILLAYSLSGKPTVIAANPREDISVCCWWNNDGTGWYECRRPRQMPPTPFGPHRAGMPPQAMVSGGGGPPTIWNLTVWFTPINGAGSTRQVGTVSWKSIEPSFSFDSALDENRILFTVQTGTWPAPPVSIKADFTGRTANVIGPAVGDGVLSPDKTRLASVARINVPSEASNNWLSFLRLHNKAKPQYHYEVDVQSLDGSNRRSVSRSANLTVDPIGGDPFETPQPVLQWLPSGRALSVGYDGKLYVVPVRR